MNRNSTSCSIYIRFSYAFNVNFVYKENNILKIERTANDSAKLAPTFEFSQKSTLDLRHLSFANSVFAQFSHSKLDTHTDHCPRLLSWNFRGRPCEQPDDPSTFVIDEAWKQATGRSVFLSFVFGMWWRFRKVKRKPFRCTDDPYFISLAERFVQPVKVLLPRQMTAESFHAHDFNPTCFQSIVVVWEWVRRRTSALSLRRIMKGFEFPSVVLHYVLEFFICFIELWLINFMII